jgi:hypothetical protein
MMWRGSILALIVFCVAWVLSHLGGGGGGLLPGVGAGVSSSAEVDEAVATPGPATGPLEIVVRGDLYFAGDRQVDLDQVITEARQGRRSPEAVRIVSGADSRLGTVRELQSALDAAGLKWGMETEP